MKNSLLFALFFMTQALATDYPSFPRLPVEEHLLGVTRTKSGIEFQVQSGGCTEKGNFYFKVELDATSGLFLIDMIREIPDYCEALLPLGLPIFISFEELGIPPGSTYQIINPIMGRS